MPPHGSPSPRRHLHASIVLMMAGSNTLACRSPSPNNDTDASGSSSGSNAGSAPDANPDAGSGGGGPVPLAPCSIWVSPTGSDSNSGTSRSDPVKNLTAAQSKARAAQSNSGKVICAMAGTFPVGSTLALTASDNGETWQYDVASGPNTAVLDGGGTGAIGSNTGVPVVIGISGGPSNIVINGLKIQNYEIQGIGNNSKQPRTNNIVVENCDIGHDSYSGQWNAGAIWLDNATNSTIANNYVHDVHWDGIMLSAYYAGESLDGDLVENNITLRTVNNPASADGSGIYISHHGVGSSGGAVVVRNNFIRDYAKYSDNTRCIYLDDSASHVTVTGNVCGWPGNSSSFVNVEGVVYHNGAHDSVSNNVFDLGSAATNWEAWFGYDGASPSGDSMVSNSFTSNVVVMNFTGAIHTNYAGVSRHAYLFWQTTQPALPTISSNTYRNYGGGAEDGTGNLANDTSPTYADPGCHGDLYELASPPAGWTPIVGGWGPPGFTIPSGTKSCPN
jgi:hypothetical protein